MKLALSMEFDHLNLRRTGEEVLARVNALKSGELISTMDNIMLWRMIADLEDHDHTDLIVPRDVSTRRIIDYVFKISPQCNHQRTLRVIANRDSIFRKHGSVFRDGKEDTLYDVHAKTTKMLGMTPAVLAAAVWYLL